MDLRNFDSYANYKRHRKAMAILKERHNIHEKDEKYKYFIHMWEAQHFPMVLKNAECVGSALINKRLSNINVENHKPGPYLYNGKRIKIKDMTGSRRKSKRGLTRKQIITDEERKKKKMNKK